jgi:hypothetical protein
MIADRIDQPEPDPSSVDVPAADAPASNEVARLTAELVAVREMLATANARLAMIETPPDWQPLKLAAFNTGQKYETVRRWCRAGKIIAKKEEGLVFCDVESIKARLNRFRDVGSESQRTGRQISSESVSSKGRSH